MIVFSAVDLYLTSCFLFVFASLVKVAVMRLSETRIRHLEKEQNMGNDVMASLKPTYCPHPDPPRELRKRDVVNGQCHSSK